MTACALTSFWTRKWVKSKDPVNVGQNCSREQWQKHFLWEGVILERKTKYMEDNVSFLVSSANYCTIGSRQDSVRVITTFLE